MRYVFAHFVGRYANSGVVFGLQPDVLVPILADDALLHVLPGFALARLHGALFALERSPCRIRQWIGPFNKVPAGVVAEDEPDALVRPPVEVDREREVRVAPDEYRVERLARELHGPVDPHGRVVVAHAVARAVDDEERLLRVRER
jgi:hypothetical protein